MTDFSLSNVCLCTSLEHLLISNKEMITDIAYENQSDDDQTLSEEVKELNEHIVNAKEKLTREIKRYSELVLDHSILSDKLQQVNKNFVHLADIFAYISNTASQCGLEENATQDNLDNAQFSIINLKTKLTEKINEDLFAIDSQLKKSGLLIKKMGEAFNIFRTLSYSYLCCICLQNYVEVFASPCGHTFCSQCLKSNFCYLCRKKVDKVNNIYFNS